MNNSTPEYETWTVPPIYDDVLDWLNYLIVLIGIPANVIVVVVIICRKSMHTLTNCYLLNLSICDILVLVTLMFRMLPIDEEIYDTYFDPYLNQLWETSALVSITTISAFTIERYLAICHPIYTYVTSQMRRTIKFLMICWIFFFILTIPSIKGAIDTFQVSNYNGDLKILKKPLYFVKTLLFFVVPLILNPVLYILIAIRISRRNKTFKDDFNIMEDAAQKANLKVLGVIILVLIITWSPMVAEIFVFQQGKECFITYFSNEDNYYFFRTCLYTLFWLSSTLNPIIYSIVCCKFRRAFEKVFITPVKRCMNCHVDETYASSEGMQEVYVENIKRNGHLSVIRTYSNSKAVEV